MKRYLFFLAVVLFAGCDKTEDNIFTQTPDERLKITADEYRKDLLSAPNGWFLAVDTKTNGAYRLWMSFEENERVGMLSDMDATFSGAGETSTEPCVSSWRLKALLAPSLIFDTYSYLHILADPQGANNGGTNSEGLVSDFEFRIVDSDNGGINLIGNYNSRLARMERATPAEAEQAVQGGLKKVLGHHNEFLQSNKFPSVEVDGKKYLMRPNLRKTEFAYVDEEGVLTELSVGSYLDFQGITKENAQSNVCFFEAAEINGLAIKGMHWTTDKYEVEINGKMYDLFDNHVPPYPLNFGYNQTFSQLYVNPSTMAGTLTDPFMSEVYTPAYNRLNKKTRAIQEMNCAFILNAISGKPVMELSITYLNTSTQKKFTAKWQYPYTVNDDGTITFTDREQTGSTNEFYYEEEMAELPDFFCTLEYSHYDEGETWADVVKSKITPHTFKIDWAENKSQGLTGNIGGMYRVGREEMYIAGQLKQ